MLRSFADGSIAMGPELAESAIDRLQRCLLRQGNSVPSGMALLKCFDSVMMPLMLHYGSSDREKGYIIGVFVSTLLASSETLALQPGFPSFWLRVIDVLCKFVSQGGGVGETTIERLKNLLLVMIVEKRFDTMSRVSEQDTLEATMTMLDSYCPTIRVDLERMLKGEVPNEKKQTPLEPANPDLIREIEKPSEETAGESKEAEKPNEETARSSIEAVEAEGKEASHQEGKNQVESNSNCNDDVHDVHDVCPDGVSGGVVKGEEEKKGEEHPEVVFVQEMVEEESEELRISEMDAISRDVIQSIPEVKEKRRKAKMINLDWAVC